MERYTIYCTAEQTKKAIELGAPIEIRKKHLCNVGLIEKVTAEQMISWLEEQEGIKDIAIAQPFHWVFIISDDICYHSTGEGFETRKEATLAAIDAALDYLSKNKK